MCDFTNHKVIGSGKHVLVHFTYCTDIYLRRNMTVCCKRSVHNGSHVHVHIWYYIPAVNSVLINTLLHLAMTTPKRDSTHNSMQKLETVTVPLFGGDVFSSCFLCVCLTCSFAAKQTQTQTFTYKHKRIVNI